MPASDVEITPVFKKSTYSITLRTDGTGTGTITASQVAANYGDEIELTPKAGEHCSFVKYNLL